MSRPKDPSSDPLPRRTISIPKTPEEIAVAKKVIRDGSSIAQEAPFLPPDNPSSNAQISKKTVTPKSKEPAKEYKNIREKIKKAVMAARRDIFSSKKDVKISEPKVAPEYKQKMDERSEKFDVLKVPGENATLEELLEFKRKAEALEAKIKKMPENERTEDAKKALENLNGILSFVEQQIDKRTSVIPPPAKTFTPQRQSRGSPPPRPVNPAPKLPPLEGEGRKPSVSSLKKR